MHTLDRRTLNRTSLQRQWLLQRRSRSPHDALTHLVGMQAQEPMEPYTGLWSRLVGFTPDALVGPLESRRAVRALMMRRTLHLLTAVDCQAMRPVFHEMMVKRVTTAFARDLAEVDIADVAAHGTPLFGEEARTTGDVAGVLHPRWPAVPRRALADVLSTVVPLVQVPPRGVWGQQAPARCTTVAAWLGDTAGATTVDEIVLRYLRAYGPAASADLRSWCGLTGLPAVIKRLSPQLRTYRDERGRVLLDVIDGELAEADQPAPVRLLPAFDNAVLGYDDRSRFIDDEHRGLSIEGARYVLVDGRVSATWTAAGHEGGVVVSVDPLRTLARADRDDIVAEATHLATFLGSGAPGRAEIGR